MPNSIRIGTRGSALALWQAHHVKNLLEALQPNRSVEIVPIKTSGDRILDTPLAQIGGKGIFIKELETALHQKQIDLAVHSCKDIPTQIPGGLMLAAILEREDVRDAFITHPGKTAQSFSALPSGAVIGTGSLRRASQILHARPDIRIVDLRGNISTRLKKLAESTWSGIILAYAGLVRLGLTQHISEVLPVETMVPAAGQGALALEIRSDDTPIKDLLAPLQHQPTAYAVSAERALLHRMEGGCQIPIGVYAYVTGDTLQLNALIGSPDGTLLFKGSRTSRPAHAEQIGQELAEDLLTQGGFKILEAIRRTAGHST